MAVRYLLRLDDACPTMNQVRWRRIETLLDRYAIKPIVAVIPCNANPLFKKDPPNHNFWEQVRTWQRKGWAIGMHGFDHLHQPETKTTWLRPQSEFRGISPQIQREKILKGLEVLKREGITPTVWVAPWHTFDKTTVMALRDYTSIRTISDGLGLTADWQDGFLRVPVQAWGFFPLPFGTVTVCLHPATMADADIRRLEKNIVRYRSRIISMEDVRAASRLTHILTAPAMLCFLLAVAAGRLKAVVTAAARRRA